MPRQVGIIRAVVGDLQARGIRVRFWPGWETRGSATFNPRGLIWHHTASARGSNGFNVVLNGRPGVPGPHAQFFLPRDQHVASMGGDVVVVAAGRANHGGRGSWRGITGNSNWWGIEPDNNGIGEVWSARMLRAYHELGAALARRTPFDPLRWLCAHHEYSPGRKIDPFGPPHGGRWDDNGPMSGRRAAVNRLRPAGEGTPGPRPQPDGGQGDEDMIRAGERGAHVTATVQWAVNEFRFGNRTDSRGLTPDGVYGLSTVAAVRRIQREFGYPATGNWDLQTDSRVRSILERRHAERVVREEAARINRRIDDVLDAIRSLRTLIMQGASGNESG